MPFGQLVIGPPGSGKTTFCNGMLHYFQLLGRKAAIVNLDPGNDSLPYECAVNIDELVALEAVQEELGLGPNGGTLYCMEYLERNVDWLKGKLAPLQGDTYLLFDCPGQVELFNMHDSLKNVVAVLTDQLHFRLTAVNLVDSHLCSDPNKFLASLLVSLSAMLHLGLPHVNVLSKVDLIEKYGELHFGLDFYTDGGDLGRLADVINQDARLAKYHRLTRSLCELVEDFGLVSYSTLNVQEEDSMRTLVALIDKANGYVYAAAELRARPQLRPAKTSGSKFSPLPQLISAAASEPHAERIGAVQERYMRDLDDSLDPDPISGLVAAAPGAAASREGRAAAADSSQARTQ